DNSTSNNSRASNRGTGSVSNGGNASYADSSTNQTGTATAGTGAAATTNQFGANAVVSSANLASYVTGISVSYSTPSDGDSGGADNRLNVGGSAFQNYAGVQSLNMNSGVGASQNSAVNVTVSAGAINLNP